MAILLFGATAHASDLSPISPNINHTYKGNIKPDSDGNYHYFMDGWSMDGNGKGYGLTKSVFSIEFISNSKVCFLIDKEKGTTVYNKNGQFYDFAYYWNYNGSVEYSRSGFLEKLIVSASQSSSYFIGGDNFGADGKPLKYDSTNYVDYNSIKPYGALSPSRFTGYYLGDGVGETALYTNMPIFYSSADCENYLRSGDDSGAANWQKDDSNVSTSIPTLKDLNLSLKVTKDNEKGLVYNFAWDSSLADKKDYVLEMNGRYYVVDKRNGQTTDSKELVEVLKVDDDYSVTNDKYTFYMSEHGLRWLETQDFSLFSTAQMRTCYLRLWEFNKAESKWQCGNYTWVRLDVGKYKNGVWYSTDFLLGNLFDGILKDHRLKITIGVGKIDVDSGGNVTDEIPDENDEEDSFDNNGNPVESGDGSLNDLIGFEDTDSILTWFIRTVKDMIGGLGQIPFLINSVFSFLPKEISIFIGLGIVVAILLRILRR